jgi:RND family efflux transporter MFP subunit
MSESKPDLSSLRIDRNPSASRKRPAAGHWVLAAVLAAVAVAAAVVLVLVFRPGGTQVRVANAVATGGGSATAGGISANGYVVARTKASVSAKILGRLEYLGVTEGSYVRKGDILARIESADFEASLGAARANVAQAEAQLAQARRDLQRAQQLRAENVISQAELEDALTTVDVTTAQLGSSRAQAELAEVNFENTRVRAPFDGTILRKDAEVGEMVAPSSAGGGLTRTAIVTMADLATLEVEVDVNEAYIARIANGQPARITLDAYPDTSFSGKVRQVVPTADRQKATVMVKVSILDRDPRILPEMGAKVVFTSAEDGAAAIHVARRVHIPADAVMNTDQGASVWVVEGDRVARRVVEVGPVDGAMVEVRKGLEGGEGVVVQPPATLVDGARVRPVGT